ncbi:MAG TPA: hypothetical protein VIN10_14010, partial [Bacteroidales bacterium]
MKKYFLVSLFLFFSASCISQKNESIQHILSVEINPGTSYIVVTDSIFNLTGSEAEFTLNSMLKITSFSENAQFELLNSDEIAKDVGMDRDDAGETSSMKLSKWKVKMKKDQAYFVLKYEGKIDFSFSSSDEDYSRGFSESAGIISDSGVYLAGSTQWVPAFGENLATFKLTTSLPEGWKTVSQGKRVKDFISDNKHTDTWLCDTPQEEVFLIAARFN